MRVAVVGGGIFGCTAAIHLARAGHDVHLYEAKNQLLTGATAHNQYRLHFGYHYPRSIETGASCRDGMAGFMAEYGDAVVWGEDHRYAIARAGSKVSADEYLTFLAASGLRYVKLAQIDHGMRNVDLAVDVSEPRYDPNFLRQLVGWRLRNVTLHMGKLASKHELPSFDRVVVAGYAAMNRAVDAAHGTIREYQYEMVEKPVIRLPGFGKRGVVVMDGPFGCIDPYGPRGSNHFVLGHVEHAIHSRNTGLWPEIPDYLEGRLNDGVVAPTPESRFPAIRDALAEFIPQVAKAEHVGSMFTCRVVLPNVDSTDRRPTEVMDDGRVITMFSGKVPTCVEAARRVVEIVNGDAKEIAA